LFIKKLILLLFLVTPLIMFQACSDTPTGAGAGLLEQDQIDVKTYDTSVDTTTITASYRKRTINLGTASRLLIGRRGSVEAGTVIRFNIVLPDTLRDQINNDSVTVESASITLTRSYLFGTDGDPLNLNVYKVNSSWLSTSFNSDSIASLQFDNTNQLTALSIADTLTTIGLQPQLALTWIKAVADTALPDEYGAYLKAAEGSNKILGYYDVSNADAALTPKLNVVYRTASGELVTVQYSTFADASVVTGDIPQVSENTIVVRAGLEVISQLRFELSDLPDNAIINKAILTLKKNAAESLAGSDYVNSLSAYFVPDSSKPDSVTSLITLNPEADKYSGDVTFYVQEWVKTGKNAGLIITATGRFTGVELFALYGPGADTASRPRLTITYTTKQ
jgi:hypothetical protein